MKEMRTSLKLDIQIIQSRLITFLKKAYFSYFPLAVMLHIFFYFIAVCTFVLHYTVLLLPCTLP